ncbi:hypothetical protein HMPREF1022_00535 [Desulfovibrio sp. 6_1_46AFAA]|uniref:nucleotidyltransferase domain-containing protein n=1 Tax=Desulfovibrio sp. 6_1_46AFAA TaxID=665942 RepID=UPI0002236B4C|nr:nucleotidyltransferase [Desulfovibrio sp. 6_1_46AFAA]EGW52562.1 hypothetical protein HMPREF1022_00535 [Desulfovibrio sp. 6_1_46AFAA]
MARDWEEQFRKWAKPPGTTEETRCSNAESAIKNALSRSAFLSGINYSAFAQGSYANNTNVRADSDVDVGVLCKDVFFYELPEGMHPEDFSIAPAPFSYADYKNAIYDALVTHFGRSAVKRGNKAIDVKENTYHVEADVAPFFEHRRYNSDGTFLSGCELRPDDNSRQVINWPQQHYSNGVDKNLNTGRRYKSVVRILKSLSCEMSECRIKDCGVCGFFIECLAWNVPNSNFGNSLYTDDIRNSLIYLYNNTKEIEKCKEWGEVSDLKYLFHGWQKWNANDANSFTLSAWNFIGF